MYLYSVEEAHLSPSEQALDVAELTRGGLESVKLDEIAGPMLGRPASMLARFYGYTSLSQLCVDLPVEANVFDAGAGLSRLGHAVTTVRPDVSWLNIDLRYELPGLSAGEEKTLGTLRSTAPANLTYVGANVFDLPAEIDAQSFDRGFSYYMFPHIIDNYGLPRSQVAMENLLKLIKPSGLFSTGPCRYTDTGWTVTVPESVEQKKLAADLIKRYVEDWDDYTKRLQQETEAAISQSFDKMLPM